MFWKCSFIKNKQNTNTSRNRHIGNIKNGIKKHKVFTSKNRHPGWQITLPDWKIKHIDHQTVKPCSVWMRRKKGCQDYACCHQKLLRRKQNPDYISGCSCKNQSNCNNQISRMTFFDCISQPVSDSENSKNSKYGQD
jgi:hypothetical protein